MNEDEMPREDDFSNAPVPSRAESAGWVVLRSDHSVVLYDPDNMSLTVRRGRAGRGTLSDRAQEPRGRRRAPRLLQNLDAADTEELAEEDNEMLSDRDRSLVRAHTPHHARARCALCHQTLPEGMSIPSPTETRSTPDSHFIHNQYFRLLAGTSEELKELAQPERKTFRTRKATNGTSAAESEGLSSKSYNDGYYERFFVETQKLGRGFRGSVFLCQHVLDGIALNEYAVKKVPVGESHAWLARMLKEVQLLERLQHPNVVGTFKSRLFRVSRADQFLQDYKHAWIEHHSPTVYGPPVPTLFVLMNLAVSASRPSWIVLLTLKDGAFQRTEEISKTISAFNMMHYRQEPGA